MATALQRLRGIARARIEATDVPLTSTTLLNWLAGPSAAAGVNVNESTALGVSSFWRGVNVLAGTVASLPLFSVKTSSGKHSVPPLFRQPHPLYTKFEWMQLTMVHRLLYGNAYALKIKADGQARPDRLFPLNPTAVEVKLARGAGKRLPTMKVFRIRLKRDDGTTEVLTLTEDEVLHIPGLGYDGISGLGLIEILKDPIGTAIAGDRFAGKFYANGTLTSGFLRTEKKLQPTDARALKERWQEKVAGLDGAHEIAVLDAGADYKSLTIPPDQAQFLESREFSVMEMARITGVPPHLLMATGGQKWGSGLEQENMGLTLFTLDPHLSAYAERFTLELLPNGSEAVFKTGRLLRGDTRARWGAYLIGRKAQALSVNEIRDEEGLPRIEDPDADDPMWAGSSSSGGATNPGGNEGNPPPDGGGDTGQQPDSEGDTDESPNEE